MMYFDCLKCVLFIFVLTLFSLNYIYIYIVTYLAPTDQLLFGTSLVFLCCNGMTSVCVLYISGLLFVNFAIIFRKFFMK